MNIKKSLLVAGAVTSISAAGLVGNSVVSAEANTSTGSETLVSKIAKKFNLKTEDVQAVVDEDRKAHQAEHTANVEKDLSQLVTDGKITAEQKDKIVAKQKELQSQREADRDSMKNKTEAERKAAMDAKKAELEKWAKDNNIPTEYLRYVMGHGHGHGHGGPHGFYGSMPHQ